MTAIEIAAFIVILQRLLTLLVLSFIVILEEHILIVPFT